MKDCDREVNIVKIGRECHIPEVRTGIMYPYSKDNKENMLIWDGPLYFEMPRVGYVTEQVGLGQCAVH